MKHIDLFSGIGGFALAADRVWPGIEHTFVEYDPFCQAVLKKHYPNSTIHGDIRIFTADTEREGWERKLRNTEGQHRLRSGSGEDEKPFILTAGVPCQPASVAGRRLGKEDDRWLWPQTFRVIELLRPEWVILENVRGLITLEQGVVFKDLLIELENLNYETRQYIIPACAVGAPHRRDRVWIVAHCGSERRQQKPRGSSRNESKDERRAEKNNNEFSGENESTWSRDWRKVALATCHDGVDDELSQRVVRLPDGSQISHAKWRKEALKAYGNAIVPAVAEEIMRAMTTTPTP